MEKRDIMSNLYVENDPALEDYTMYFTKLVGGIIDTVIYDENGEMQTWDTENPVMRTERELKIMCESIIRVKNIFLKKDGLNFNDLSLGQLKLLNLRISIFLEWYKKHKEKHKGLYSRALNIQLQSWEKEIKEAILLKTNLICIDEEIKGEYNVRKEETTVTDKKNLQELTEREKEYYNKAITKGMAKKTQTGYKWIYCKGNVTSLAFFLEKIFAPKGVGIVPNKRLENLWSVSRLDRAFDRNRTVKKPQEWRFEIEQLFTTE